MMSILIQSYGMLGSQKTWTHVTIVFALSKPTDVTGTLSTSLL